jgi:uncharacterized protein (TIGR00661 family)
MIFSQKDNIPSNLTILVAPLDWGLGHATRCIPVIKFLQSQNHQVIIAAEQSTEALLKQALTEVTFIQLKGYRIKYSTSSIKTLVKLLYQIPSILLSIYKEHQWVKKVVKKYSVDVIISDNRFGLFHKTIPCVFITHQLMIQTGTSIGNKLLQQLNYFFIHQFAQCWVPDVAANNNIAGNLSHPKWLPNNVHYIGPLSRLSKVVAEKKEYALAILLSGPEPQRTIFEKLLLQQAASIDGKILLVRGLPIANSETALNLPNNVMCKAYLAAPEISKAVAESVLVICRSGYSTIMDLIAIKAPAILVPTPGQTEQIYLAKHLQQQGYFYCTTQQNLDVSAVIKSFYTLKYLPPKIPVNTFEQVIVDFLFTVSKTNTPIDK